MWTKGEDDSPDPFGIFTGLDPMPDCAENEIKGFKTYLLKTVPGRLALFWVTVTTAAAVCSIMVSFAWSAPDYINRLLKWADNWPPTQQQPTAEEHKK